MTIDGIKICKRGENSDIYFVKPVDINESFCVDINESFCFIWDCKFFISFECIIGTITNPHAAMIIANTPVVLL